MRTLRLLANTLFVVATLAAAAACSSVQGSSHVQSSGTPVNPFTDPGGADQPSAPLTGAQSQHP